MQVIKRVMGIDVAIGGDGTLYVGGKPPTDIEHLFGDVYRVHAYFLKHKNPKKVSGARKRKKALQASVKKFRYSINMVGEKA